jgi:ribosome-associated toxin RatA of RatAB toxin-antitoxin module
MGLETTESVTVATEPSGVFPYVAALDEYPAWLPLVHTAWLEEPSQTPAWLVEIRAHVGPFARSKRLRMVRVLHRVDRLVQFEREELDGRRHARWMLRVTLEPAAESSTLVTMHLAYDGSLWTGAVLDRVLAEEVRRGRDGLAELVNAAPTH